MNDSVVSSNDTDTWQWYKEVVQSWLEHPGAEHGELNMTALKMDQAYVVGAADRNVGVYSVSDDCFRCPYELQKSLSEDAEETWVVSTVRRATWRVYADTTDQYISSRNTTGMLCQLRPDVGQFGVYRLNVTDECTLTTEKEPVNIYMPLLLLLGLLACVWIMYGVVKLIMSRVRRTGKLCYGDKELAIQQRLRALDTFRGIAIVLMIFINDGAGGYWLLEHATWNGLLIGDLVFPAFLWIMGVCIPLSIKSAFAKGIPRWKILLNIVWRSMILFLLGVSLNTIYGSNMLQELRIFGVLQRLTVAYLISAGFYVLTAPKYYAPPRGACGQALKDVLSCVWCWALAAVLVAVHTAITFTVHDPNCPAGYLGPGGKHDDWVAPECSGGAAGYIDRLLLGPSHLFQNSEYRHVYGGPPVDPEGILGCLTSAVQVLLGVQAGATALLQRSHKARVSRWAAWAVVYALAGALLAGFSREHGVIPLNKNLWYCPPSSHYSGRCWPASRTSTALSRSTRTCSTVRHHLTIPGAAGRLLARARRYPTQQEPVVLSTIISLFRALLAGFSREHSVIPLNKNLWYCPPSSQYSGRCWPASRASTALSRSTKTCGTIRHHLTI